jgi:hypothetical protein
MPLEDFLPYLLVNTGLGHVLASDWRDHLSIAAQL